MSTTPPAQHRERRAWTEEEDRQLLEAIAAEDPGANPPSKWHAIATRVTGRTNKDCRKRWWAQMAGQVAKGAWSAEEDDKLSMAVHEHGQKWAVVAQRVATRNSGQCAKRWTDALDPAINRQEWTDEEDVKLLEAVKSGGKQWATIVRTHLIGRTGLAAKNRYNHLIRTSGERAAGRDRRKQQAAPYPQRVLEGAIAAAAAAIASASATEPLQPPPPDNILPFGGPADAGYGPTPEHAHLAQLAQQYAQMAPGYEDARQHHLQQLPVHDLPPLRMGGQPSPGIPAPGLVPHPHAHLDPHAHHALTQPSALPPPTGPPGPQGPQLAMSREPTPPPGHTPQPPIPTPDAQYAWAPWSVT